MRQLTLDTETTGLNAQSGDRIVEIGCVELINRQLSGQTRHFYLNPERESAKEALAVHGLTTEFLRDKPKFAQIAFELCAFMQGAQIIIHNAPFDLAFLDAELALLGLPPFQEHCGVEIIDTLALARTLFPGKRNSLDALCERFGVDNTHRTLHGALLDTRLLAHVYLAMTRGQESLGIELSEPSAPGKSLPVPAALDAGALPVRKASPDEVAAHRAMLDELERTLKAPCAWRSSL
ncbi:DNA polymerase III, subunit epsilon [Candidatus Glomeribacter gigasporarum BEG34]|uniref:DNA polymerase III subunit epsilon n=1 Tax=Candidatus Glomeribacter gigasporarum BEG34 TaxID=1070319 RepID=G2J9Z0_9BURK|nr:DNA polymerase III subunit epsilon [Candidatus Glomeribacter gigasporarum]CCD29587.1 DNA polymerase III, subunit epsilon [Candidatus Glomeribacter gigasporarum BEG34]